MNKYFIGWKQLAKAKNEEIVSVNFQAPRELRKRFMEIIKSNPRTNAEIEFLKWMNKFIKKYHKYEKNKGNNN